MDFSQLFQGLNAQLLRDGRNLALKLSPDSVPIDVAPSSSSADLISPKCCEYLDSCLNFVRLGPALSPSPSGDQERLSKPTDLLGFRWPRSSESFGGTGARAGGPQQPGKFLPTCGESHRGVVLNPAS